jgi:RimJ/RimL family protein N-acetyltransferase
VYGRAVPGNVVLRATEDGDLPILFQNQRDPEASAMAAFPPRDWDAFVAHQQRIRTDENVVTKTIVCDGSVAGSIGSWEQDGGRLVGYWIGREHWGKGVATKALARFLDEVPARPLHAHVATDNVGSIRVLEKCGFARVGRASGDDGVEEFLYELSA